VVGFGRAWKIRSKSVDVTSLLPRLRSHKGEKRKDFSVGVFERSQVKTCRRERVTALAGKDEQITVGCVRKQCPNGTLSLSCS